VINQQQTTWFNTACKVCNGNSIIKIVKEIKDFSAEKIKINSTFGFSNLLQSQANEQMSFLDR
jgi:hypothetical protein